MLEKILKLYTMAMAYGVRSPLPHLFGPPGCGKSTVVEIAADVIGVKLHIINVSRLSPLEVEGVQMPHGDGKDMVLKMLPATFWSSLQHGDIVLLDEFLRAFPEVYNALLDILTSRRAGAFPLPEVFIIAASNSTVAYDKALEDRLLHLPVADPRTDKKEFKRLADMLVDQLGLLPEMAKSYEVEGLLNREVLPMYEILDQIGKPGGGAAPSLKGRSLRNLIGQAQLREVQCVDLREVIDTNNRRACQQGKEQYVLLLDGRKAHLPSNTYVSAAESIFNNEKAMSKLTEIQARNLEFNLQLIEMESIRNEKKGDTADDDVFV